jgi:peptidoglycan hydrolase-like protein with peptidoglycan-binding domain
MKAGRFLFIALALLLSAFLVVGCSSSDSSSSDDSSKDESSEKKEEPSDTVKELQKELKELGYYDGDIDGLYGSETEEAVKEFQKEAGITVDGKYGPATHKALVEALDKQESEATKHIQEMLSDLGYYTGDINGKYDTATEDAVKAFQEEQGLTADGIVGPKTLAALEDAAKTGDTGDNS